MALSDKLRHRVLRAQLELLGHGKARWERHAEGGAALRVGHLEVQVAHVHLIPYGTVLAREYLGSGAKVVGVDGAARRRGGRCRAGGLVAAPLANSMRRAYPRVVFLATFLALLFPLLAPLLLLPSLLLCCRRTLGSSAPLASASALRFWRQSLRKRMNAFSGRLM